MGHVTRLANKIAHLGGNVAQVDMYLQVRGGTGGRWGLGVGGFYHILEHILVTSESLVSGFVWIRRILDSDPDRHKVVWNCGWLILRGRGRNGTVSRVFSSAHAYGEVDERTKGQKDKGTKGIKNVLCSSVWRQTIVESKMSKLQGGTNR